MAGITFSCQSIYGVVKFVSSLLLGDFNAEDTEPSLSKF